MEDNYYDTVELQEHLRNKISDVEKTIASKRVDLELVKEQVLELTKEFESCRRNRDLTQSEKDAIELKMFRTKRIRSGIQSSVNKSTGYLNYLKSQVDDSVTLTHADRERKRRELLLRKSLLVYFNEEVHTIAEKESVLEKLEIKFPELYADLSLTNSQLLDPNNKEKLKIK